MCGYAIGFQRLDSLGEMKYYFTEEGFEELYLESRYVQ